MAELPFVLWDRVIIDHPLKSSDDIHTAALAALWVCGGFLTGYGVWRAYGTARHSLLPVVHAAGRDPGGGARPSSHSRLHNGPPRRRRARRARQ